MKLLKYLYSASTGPRQVFNISLFGCRDRWGGGGCCSVSLTPIIKTKYRLIIILMTAKEMGGDKYMTGGGGGLTDLMTVAFHRIK